jgi:hypothetical protein
MSRTTIGAPLAAFAYLSGPGLNRVLTTVDFTGTVSPLDTSERRVPLLLRPARELHERRLQGDLIHHRRRSAAPPGTPLSKGRQR